LGDEGGATFCYHQVSEERKVPLETLIFQGYVMYWWRSLDKERRLPNSSQVQYWNDLKNALRKRHIPFYYHRELMEKLQRLHQKSLGVEEYW